jgi:CubicO group peptidase (beta-lactamase class C family)
LIGRPSAALILLLACAGSACAGEPPRQPRQTAPRDPRIDALMAEAVAPDGPGCAVTVLRRGEVVHSQGYGLADVGRGVAITPRTPFDVGSIAKQFTAAVVVRLAGRGRLSLDDPLRKHLPELPAYLQPVTLRHLIHHTGGLRDYLNLWILAGRDFAGPASLEDAVATITRQRALNFNPGERFLYSNSGYILLGLMAGRVSGKPFADLARDEIFKPLGMAGTAFGSAPPGQAEGYMPRVMGMRPVRSAFALVGDGGLRSNAEDLARWAASGNLAGRPAERGFQTDYAQGLFVRPYRGLETVGHGGNFLGYSADLLHFPGQRLAVVCLCNSSDLEAALLSRRIAEVYLEKEMAPAAAPPAREPLGRYAGLYLERPTSTFRRIVLEDGRLRMERGQGRVNDLVPLGGGRFRLSGALTDTLVSFPEPGRMEERAGGERPAVYYADVTAAVAPAAAAPPGEADPEAYAGRYASEELGVEWTVAVRAGRLVLLRPGLGETALEPVERDGFRDEGLGAVWFQRTPEGAVTGFRLDGARAWGIGFTRAPAGSPPPVDRPAPRPSPGPAPRS